MDNTVIKVGDLNHERLWAFCYCLTAFTLKHNVMFYTGEDNNLQKSAFVDFEKLTRFQIDQNIAVHQLMDTKTLGSYYISFDTSPYEEMKDSSNSKTRHE